VTKKELETAKWEAEMIDLRLSQAKRLWRNQDLDALAGAVAAIDRLRVREYTSSARERGEPIDDLLEKARAALLEAEQKIRELAR